MKLSLSPNRRRVTLHRAKGANLTMATSGLVTITLFAILMIWDGFTVYFGGGTQSSVSQWIISWTGINPIPFYAGTIAGHLFCNMWPDPAPLKAAFAAYKANPSADGLVELERVLESFTG